MPLGLEKRLCPELCRSHVAQILIVKVIKRIFPHSFRAAFSHRFSRRCSRRFCAQVFAQGFAHVFAQVFAHLFAHVFAHVFARAFADVFTAAVRTCFSWVHSWVLARMSASQFLDLFRQKALALGSLALISQVGACRRNKATFTQHYSCSRTSVPIFRHFAPRACLLFRSVTLFVASTHMPDNPCWRQGLLQTKQSPNSFTYIRHRREVVKINCFERLFSIPVCAPAFSLRCLFAAIQNSSTPWLRYSLFLRFLEHGCDASCYCVAPTGLLQGMHPPQLWFFA